MQVAELLNAYASGDVVGRDGELAELRQLFADAGPRVAHVYGDAGIGKSTLVGLFAAMTQQHDAECILMDCREIEPTAEGFLGALAAAMGHARPDLAHLVDALAAHQRRPVIVLDSFEVLRLLDTWLRLTFAPALSANARIVLAGRHRPSVGWYAGGWEKPTLILPLGPLASEAAEDLLQRLGVSSGRRRLARMLHGHPLAIRLAARTLRQRPGLRLPDASLQQVMDELTSVYLSDVDDPTIRPLLEGAALVRRVSVPLLRTLFPAHDPEHAYGLLKQLDFAEVLPDGLSLHDAVKEALAQTLRARDPKRYFELRRQAWRTLVGEARDAPRPELWRYTADILYLIENPVVREAFFPSGASELVVEQAHSEDFPAIRALIETHEGPDGARALLRWWRRLPEAFVVARDAWGQCRGLCCRFDPAKVDPGALAEDAVTRTWSTDLRENPMPPGSRSLFIRRWLDREAGENPCDAQAALWLDLKRTYMEMRPELRRVYLTVCDLGPYAAVAEKLGIRPLPQRSVALDGRAHATAALDFGEASVEGWLAGLAAAELGISGRPEFLDRDARELVFRDRRTPLTPLEFGVLVYLVDRPGEAVDRERLLREVWRTRYTGWSNKVDAVVAGLRRKLGDHARRIETVTGVGYRYRP
ncbi:winged helix-turn-helix domain-containing protein [Arhodomonas sp. AD133]|uniref:winged helix-turn-helix domain-containing protein n=1 Tax=Arhodomonas sp. AD133 TaxID=3415009 RepID=UPI003EBAEBD8